MPPQEVARRKAGELRGADPSLVFRFGFHSAPSLRQLHLHVISQVGACRQAAAPQRGTWRAARGTRLAGRRAAPHLRPPPVCWLPSSVRILAPSLTCAFNLLVPQDFDSVGLKNKKHWNSFTHPQFWVDGPAALGTLRQHGALSYSLAAAEAALKADLRCHRCRTAQPNMPQLKAHIARCGPPPPGERSDGGGSP